MDQIKLFKNRSFGDLISDSFTIYIQNIKVLGMAILVYAGPFLLLQGLATGMYTYEILKFTQNVSGANPFEDINSIIALLSSLGLTVLLLIAGAMLGTSSLVGVVNNFLIQYQEKGVENLSYQEIGAAAMRDLGKNIGASLLIGLIAFAATLLFILPGIYVGVALSLVYAVMKFESIGVSEAMGRSFKLIRGHWWQTLGLVIVISIMVGIVSAIIRLPFTSMFTFSSIRSELPNYPVMLFTMGIITIITGALQGLTLISVSIQYCSLTDISPENNTDSLIDEIGADDFTNSPNNPF